VVRIALSPLREREDDIPLLVNAFIREFAESHRKPVTGIAPEALRVLRGYPWPGNIRELKNCIESMVVVSRNRILQPEDIPDKVRADQSGRPSIPPPTPGRSLDETEKELIIQTLHMLGGNRQEAAKLLKIGERTLYRKLDKYGIR
jgi:two-component system response regulator HydG